MGNEIAVGIGINVVTALIFASLSYLAGISLAANAPEKLALRGPIALFAVLMFATMLLLFGIWKRDSSPYYHGISALSEGETSAVPQPDWAFLGPVALTAVPPPPPSSTPTNTPLPPKSATPTPTNTASPSPSPTTTAPANTQTPTPTASPSPTWSPTPIPPVQITYRDQDCSRPSHNARITDAFLEVPSGSNANAAYVTLYGVAYRQDFSKYVVYWSNAAKPEESVEDGVSFEFDRALESPSVLQSRPAGELARPSEYRVTLRVLGTNNGQHQQCQVTIRIR